MDKKTLTALHDKIKLLKDETPQTISIQYLTGSSEGIRVAFESIVSRQHRMLEIMEDIVEKFDRLS